MGPPEEDKQDCDDNNAGQQRDRLPFHGALSEIVQTTTKPQQGAAQPSREGSYQRCALKFEVFSATGKKINLFVRYLSHW
jgi:hypothetical protein